MRELPYPPNEVRVAQKKVDVTNLLERFDVRDKVNKKLTLRVRPAVSKFSREMEKKLRENDQRLGWRECTDNWLLMRLLCEVNELSKACYTSLNNEDVIREAADVANFAMMIADNRGKPNDSR